jgi:hypothetical protein
LYFPAPFFPEPVDERVLSLLSYTLNRPKAINSQKVQAMTMMLEKKKRKDFLLKRRMNREAL